MLGIDFKEIVTIGMVLFAVIDIVGTIPIIVDLRQKYGHIESEKASLAAVAHMARNFDVPYIGTTDKTYTHTASNTLAKNALERCVDFIFFL